MLRLLPLALATLAVATTSIRAVLAKVGHPGAALDDAYIHFQYARAIAEGHPFRYQAGEPISTGATSFLWPAVLSIPYLLGFHGESLLWPAWFLAFVALGALAWETYALAEPLAGPNAAIGAGAMSLFFGGHLWGAASGMEVVPFAWLIAHATRRACRWVEDPSFQTRRELYTLLALALAAPLARPEGALTSIVIGIAVFRHRRLAGVGIAACALVPNLLYLLLTGHATSSTAQVKLLNGNPYFDFVSAATANAKLLVSTILDGEVYSSEFLPKGGAIVAMLGLLALAWRGWETRKFFRASAVLVIALTMFVPCTYYTFLWNRLRYLWPFSMGWFVGLACLARILGNLFARVSRKDGVAMTTLLAGGVAGMLFVRLEWVIDDVAQSASGISRQQVALGHWAKSSLPEGARIGVNDTGAIAYFGDRKTFDVVGLTTATEGKHWVAGAASRLEHYERMKKEAPSMLPTHFIVYPEWMGLDAVLGKRLHEAVVTDSSILGGQVMRAYEARWNQLGTGDLPWSSPGFVVEDELDVADLESEAAHGYQLLMAREGEEVVLESNAPDGHVVLDGGRTNRTYERFSISRGSRALMRIGATGAIVLVIKMDHVEKARVPVDGETWTEVAFPVRAGDVEVIAEGGTFTSFHYWFGR